MDIITYDDSITKADADELRKGIVRVSETLSKLIKSETLTSKEKIIGIVGAIILLIPFDMISISPEVAKFIDDAVVLLFIASKKNSKKKAA